MQKRFIALTVCALMVASACLAIPAAAAANESGFDEFGYNYQARIFVGKLDGVDRTLDGLYDGDTTYANDQLVMKWSKAWDDGMRNKGWGPGAWCSDEINGVVPGGSGETEHVKMVWVGTGSNGDPLFEVITDQGTTDLGHYWGVHATPTGYGAWKQVDV